MASVAVMASCWTQRIAVFDRALRCHAGTPGRIFPMPVNCRRIVHGLDSANSVSTCAVFLASPGNAP